MDRNFSPSLWLGHLQQTVQQCKERLMGQAGQGGGCGLVILGGRGQGWPQGPSGSTAAQLGLCQRRAGLSSRRAVRGWQVFCMMLMRAVAGGEQEAVLLSCACPAGGSSERDGPSSHPRGRD